MSQDKTYTIELSERHISIIGAALIEAPYKVAEPVIREINRQLGEAQLAEDKS